MLIGAGLLIATYADGVIDLMQNLLPKGIELGMPVADLKDNRPHLIGPSDTRRNNIILLDISNPERTLGYYISDGRVGAIRLMFNGDTLFDANEQLRGVRKVASEGYIRSSREDPLKMQAFPVEVFTNDDDTVGVCSLSGDLDHSLIFFKKEAFGADHFFVSSAKKAKVEKGFSAARDKIENKRARILEQQEPSQQEPSQSGKIEETDRSTYFVAALIIFILLLLVLLFLYVKRKL